MFSPSFLLPAGGTGSKLWGVHHYEPSWKRLRGQTEASRQPEAAVQACGHEQTRQRADCWSHPLLRGLQKRRNTWTQTGCNLQLGQVQCLYSFILLCGMAGIKIYDVVHTFVSRLIQSDAALPLAGSLSAFFLLQIELCCRHKMFLKLSIMPSPSIAFYWFGGKLYSPIARLRPDQPVPSLKNVFAYLFFLCCCCFVQGAFDSPAALWLGFTCSEDRAEGLWQSPAAAEGEPWQGQV